MLIPQALIAKKRDGQALSAAEIGAFVDGITDGSITDAQLAAFAMAVFFVGMDADEVVALTTAMRDSGHVLSWDQHDLPGPVVDKHSTGGVGDVVSLMLGPMLAACGAFVPMISGRGLGHTGGTLDKFDSIPGYQTTPSPELFVKTVKEVGVAIIGQTADLAPADKRFYATRDVTATVESIPLITASILSKKLAAGLQALVMDVKAGSGAFMPSYDQSVELAKSIVTVANGAGTPTSALLTDMNQVLADSAGNALEVREAIRYLRGDHRNERLHAVTMALCIEALLLGGLHNTDDEAKRALEHVLDSGAAAQKFQHMVSALGGPDDVIDNYQPHLTLAPVTADVHAPAAGYVKAIDTRAVGMAVVALGGGRTRAQDDIDPAVGLSQVASIGMRVDSHRPIATVHARTDADAQAASAAIIKAFELSDDQDNLEARDVYARLRHGEDRA